MCADNVQSAIRCCIMAIAEQRGNGGRYGLRIRSRVTGVRVRLQSGASGCANAREDCQKAVLSLYGILRVAC